jgi:hypothetical protein
MSGSSAPTRCIALPRLAIAISRSRGLTAMDHTRASEARLRRVFIEAEISARRATDALLTGLPMSREEVRRPAQFLVGYCIQCPDPFQALIIARVLRPCSTTSTQAWTRMAHSWSGRTPGSSCSRWPRTSRAGCVMTASPSWSRL